MDTVPYAFRTAVAATQRKPSIIGSNFSSKLWRRAAEEVTKHRLNCVLSITYANGLWEYSIQKMQHNKSVSLSFQEFKNLNRKHIRFTIVKIGSPCFTPNPSSFEEIKAIVRYTRPCVNMAEFSLISTRNYPQTDLLELLSLHKNTFFHEILTYSTTDTTLEFLLPHLKSTLLKSLSVQEESCSTKLKYALQDAALHGNYKFFQVLIRFGMKFYADLLLVQQQPAANMKSCFFHSSDFRFFKYLGKDLQIIDHGEDFIRWRRADCIEVSVSKVGNRLYVQFVKCP